MSTEQIAWYYDSIEAGFSSVKEVFLKLRTAGLQPKSIFDIGSSNAGWSGVMLQLFPFAQFDLFEPLLQYKAHFRAFSSLVCSKGPSVFQHETLLGNARKLAVMHSDDDGFGASVLPRAAIGELRQRISLQMVRLDDYRRKHGLPSPDVLKLDVQGAELLVLRGAIDTLRTVQVIQTEVWFVRDYGPKTPLFHEIQEFLHRRAFQLFELCQFYYPRNHELHCGDAIFVRRDVLKALFGDG
jgi:FkbM family methyltransferase